jgi:hypothetical protein
MNTAIARELGPLDIVGMSREVRAGIRPIHGARLPPDGGASGWYFWAGPRAPRGQRFEPMSAAHACAVVPELEGYLNLPPGTRLHIQSARDARAWVDPRLERARG